MTKKNVDEGELHPRAMMVRDANRELALAMKMVVERYHLTGAEILQCVARILVDLAQFSIREERHGTHLKPGDLK